MLPVRWRSAHRWRGANRGLLRMLLPCTAGRNRCHSERAAPARGHEAGIGPWPRRMPPSPRDRIATGVIVQKVPAGQPGARAPTPARRSRQAGSGPARTPALPRSFMVRGAPRPMRIPSEPRRRRGEGGIPRHWEGGYEAPTADAEGPRRLPSAVGSLETPSLGVGIPRRPQPRPPRNPHGPRRTPDNESHCHCEEPPCGDEAIWFNYNEIASLPGPPSAARAPRNDSGGGGTFWTMTVRWRHREAARCRAPAARARLPCSRS